MESCNITQRSLLSRDKHGPQSVDFIVLMHVSNHCYSLLSLLYQCNVVWVIGSYGCPGGWG